MILESSTLLEKTLALMVLYHGQIYQSHNGIFFVPQIIFDYIFDHGWYDLPLDVLIKQTHSKILFYSAL